MPLFGRKKNGADDELSGRPDASIDEPSADFDLLVAGLGPSDVVQRFQSFVELGGDLSGDQVAELRDDLSRRQNVVLKLGETADPRAVEPLIDLATGPIDAGPVVIYSDVASLRTTAVASLSLLGATAVPGLIATLSAADPKRRAVAASALGPVGDPRAVEALIDVLGDEEFEVREQAAASLGQCGDSRSVQALIAALEDTAPRVRESAHDALVSLGELCVDALVEALGSDVAIVRRDSAQLLGQIGNARAADGLMKALTDEVAFVREGAATALGELGAPAAREPLSRLLSDPDFDVRRCARAALEKLPQ